MKLKGETQILKVRLDSWIDKNIDKLFALKTNDLKQKKKTKPTMKRANSTQAIIRKLSAFSNISKDSDKEEAKRNY